MAEDSRRPEIDSAPGPETQRTREDRIRTALGTKGGLLPPVERGWLSRYGRYLESALTTPFAAQYVGAAGMSSSIAVVVLSVLDPNTNSTDERDGLICAASHQEQQLKLALIDIEVEADHPNYQLLDDYWYWFWNWRFDPRI